VNELGTNQREKIREGEHLTVTRRTTVSDYPTHWHGFFEIEVIISGKGECGINAEVYDMESCRVYLLASTDLHYQKIKAPITLINVSFDEHALCESDLILITLGRCDKAYRLSEKEYESVVKACELLLEEYESGGERARELLSYLIGYLTRRSRGGERISDGGEKGITRAITYMQLHFKESLTLADISREAGYHPSYFSELFKKVTGQSVTDALKKLRTEHARVLLSGGFSVSDACFTSGFGSYSGFLEAFREETGLSPTEYKKRAQKKGL
jgi:AraC-like DNA-binding protein